MFSLFKKKCHQISVPQHAVSFEVKPGATVLEAALANGLALPHDCKVGTCGTCRYRLREGRVREIRPSALALSAQQLDAGYRLGCQSVPRSDLTIDLDELAPEPVFQRNRVDGIIVAATSLSHDIVQLSVRLKQPMPFVAGQYADLTVPAVDGARSYSFSSAPKGKPAEIVNFHIRRVPNGAFTGWLFSGERVGLEISVCGPQGNFHLREHDHAPILCVGGGSGLAPLLSILEEALWAGSVRPVTLLYGARTQKDLYCIAEIKELAAAWPAAFRYIPVLSAEPEDTDWHGARGFVSDHISGVADLSAHHAYLCGPPPMVDAAESALLNAGLPATAIHADRFYDRGLTAS